MKLNRSVWLVAILGTLGACGPKDGENPNESVAPAAHSGVVPDNLDSSKLDILRSRIETPDPDYVMVIAHRACWHEAPENSIAAMQACVDMGVDMIEIDVRVSADGVLVMMHDETVDRTTNGTGRVDELTLADLQSLVLRESAGGPDAALTEHRIPTLEQALDALRGRILINLDTKGEVLLDAIAAVRRQGVGKQILFKTTLAADDPILQGMDLPEDSYFMPVVRNDGPSLADHVENYSWVQPVAVEVVFDDSAYLENGAAGVVDAGLRLWVNTLWEGLAASYTDAAALEDPDANWGVLLDLGVSMIQTDEPRALLEYLQERGLR